ncbi:MAG: cupin domain-containing protein [Ruminococcaceae bacterium]|nr:cupin domain-containing protein [Oscillospiraceae bacterium]
MEKIKQCHISELTGKHKAEHADYEYVRKTFVSRGSAEGTLVSVYEIPPLKSAYPYHYHLKDEETFYIISGEGILRTPEGERPVRAGDLLFFPASCEGAHKLTNTSSAEKLIYIDFDVIHDLDVAVYPDSGKIGIWGKDVNRVYPTDANVDYYKDE